MAPLILQGCAIITPEASKVIIYSQVSTLLDDCERLGTIQSR